MFSHENEKGTCGTCSSYPVVLVYQNNSRGEDLRGNFMFENKSYRVLALNTYSSLNFNLSSSSVPTLQLFSTLNKDLLERCLFRFFRAELRLWFDDLQSLVKLISEMRFAIARTYEAKL